VRHSESPTGRKCASDIRCSRRRSVRLSGDRESQIPRRLAELPLALMARVSQATPISAEAAAGVEGTGESAVAGVFARLADVEAALDFGDSRWVRRRRWSTS